MYFGRGSSILKKLPKLRVKHSERNTVFPQISAVALITNFSGFSLLEGGAYFEIQFFSKI